MAGENISYIVAFVAGFLTYLSPCLLPLIPSFIAYIAGVSFADLKDSEKKSEVRKKAIIHSLLFILGFSIVFILLGLTATAIGKAFFQYQKAIRIIGGSLIITFGLYLAGILKLDFLAKEKRFNIQAKGASYFGSFLVGVTFAAAWTPCAGPILGSILVLAGTKADIAQGAKLLTVYSLGIGVPFFLTALAINSFLAYFNRFKKVIGIINIIGGIFLIIIGILVITNYLAVISGKLLGAFTK
ncbi:MAG: sulfite exporter TauE/SafE family protein [Candidatus Omnitrophica bacterium]|nr:sulfite exporter TauE/SafE family protein [Candidatus Omnitrophota bacterium]